MQGPRTQRSGYCCVLAARREPRGRCARVTGNPRGAEDWLQSGRLYSLAGQKDQALRSYQSLLDNFPQSQSVGEARIRMKEAVTR